MGGCCGKNKKKKGRRSVYTAAKLSETQRALRELVDTERDFGENMKCLVENYLDPLRKDVIFFDNTDLILLNNVTLDLVQVQRKFQDSLVAHTDNIGDTGADMSDIIYDVAEDFINSEKDFDIFSKYVVVMTKVQKVINDKSNDDMIKFLEKCAQSITSDNGQKNMTMDSLILTPFQRPLKYPLILERLEAQTEDGTIDKKQLVDAQAAMKKVATKMNDTLKKDEQTGEVYKQLLKQYGILEYRHKS